MSKHVFKLIVGGSGGAGKTTLINKYTTGQFLEDTKITIGISFSVHDMKMEERDVDLSLQIWDLGGEERFRMILPSYCMGAKGCILAFDLKRDYTFEELGEWINIVKSSAGEIPIILIGTKYDTIEKTALDMKMEKIKEFMSEYNLPKFYHVSSKTGLNVKDTFIDISNLMLDKINGKKVIENVIN